MLVVSGLPGRFPLRPGIAGSANENVGQGSAESGVQHFLWQFGRLGPDLDAVVEGFLPCPACWWRRYGSVSRYSVLLESPCADSSHDPRSVIHRFHYFVSSLTIHTEQTVAEVRLELCWQAVPVVLFFFFCCCCFVLLCCPGMW